MIILIILALGFDFLNGIHDSSNIVATMITSKALPPRWSFTIIAIAEFAGPFIFGVAVANTIGKFVTLGDVPDAAGEHAGLPKELGFQSVQFAAVVAERRPVSLLPVPLCPVFHDAKPLRLCLIIMADCEL